jgi:branched-chain amino acid transport system permease protein
MPFDTFVASFLGINWQEAAQLATNGLINGSSYGLLGVGFALILGVSGRFHFAFAFTYTLTAYIAAVAATDAGINFWLSLVLGLLAGTAAGVAIEAVVYRPVAARSGPKSLLTIFVASLGLTIAGENAIRLKWGSGSKIFESFVNRGHALGSVTFTRVDIISVLTILVLVVLVQAVLQMTPLGRQIRAVRANPEMARAVGIEIAHVYLAVFAIGSILAGFGALFAAVKFAAVPDMGVQPVFYAFLVAFLAGTRSAPLVALAVGIGVGLVESLSALWVSVQWSSLVVFAILFLYLSYRSASVSLGRLRLPGDARLRLGLSRTGAR